MTFLRIKKGKICYNYSMRPRGSSDELLVRRLRAAELFDRGWSLSAVAREIGCSVSSVFRWRKTYKRHGKEGLASKPIPGRPPKMTKQQRNRLGKWIGHGAYNYFGLSNIWWTQRLVAKQIKRRFAIKYHPNHIYKMLRRMGYHREDRMWTEKAV